MSIKTSFKMLLNRFEIIGEILLFLLIFIILLCSLGAIFIQPIIQSAMDLGLVNKISELFTSILSRNEIDIIYANGREVLDTIKHIFIGDEGIIFKTVAVPMLFYVIFNLFGNWYELPLCKVLDARMSANAKLSLIGKVVSLSGKSSLYVLVKLLFSIVTDVVIFLAMWGSYLLLKLFSMTFFVPFAELLVLLLLISFRKCFTVTWTQNIIIEGKKIFPALGKSIKDGFCHFGGVFTRYFICWLIIYVFNGLMSLLTFGVGLIVSVPASILFIKIFEMVAYYSWNNKRFYLDTNKIVDPLETSK